MHKHHIDAIAVDTDADYGELLTWLDRNAPDMPIFQIADSADEQMEIIREIELLLNQLHTDESNDDYDESYYFKQARERWMKHLISGLAPSRAHILSHHRLYRCAEDPDGPCVFARMSVPEGDSFITGRWHYGSERLGTALGNFFGEEFDHHPIHVAVATPEEIRVVVCQRIGQGDRPVSLESARGYIEETIEQIQNYLGLRMTIVEISLMDGLTAFAADHADNG